MDHIIQAYMQELRSQGLLLPAWYENGKVIMMNQVKLPSEEYVFHASYPEVAESIQKMVIRGSGAIALAGIYGILLAAFESHGDPRVVKQASIHLKATRPTAVNMHQTVDSLSRNIHGLKGERFIEDLQIRAVQMMKSQLDVERKIGENGAQLISPGERILTICHAGALAGFGYGGRTLSVFRKAVEQKKEIHVFACETRPYLQGARITAWELQELGIPVTLITDNMAGALMQKGMIDRVITGSDRLARNGDTANKIGTYLLSLAAKDHGIPFHISTSRYNVDLQTSTGKEIEIEMRDSSEVLFIHGERITAEGIDALYPGFDITPNENITAIITENGILRSPYEEKLISLVGEIER